MSWGSVERNERRTSASAARFVSGSVNLNAAFHTENQSHQRYPDGACRCTMQSISPLVTLVLCVTAIAGFRVNGWRRLSGIRSVVAATVPGCRVMTDSRCPLRPSIQHPIHAISGSLDSGTKASGAPPQPEADYGRRPASWLLLLGLRPRTPSPQGQRLCRL